MKNKDKFVKIVNIISKVLIGIMIALLVLCVGVVCFRACSVDKQVAYASETDGIGTWVWNESLGLLPSLSYLLPNYFLDEPPSEPYIFDFTCDGVDYVGVYDGPTSEAFDSNFVLVFNGGWNNGDVNSPYRTIDIKTAPPANFLTMLQANATYQGGTTPEPVEYSVTKSISNGTMPGGANTIPEGGSANYQIAPNTGYTFPQTVQVTNAEHTYDSSTGVITVSNPTGNVTIFVTCPLQVNPVNAIRGRYVFMNTLSFADISSGTLEQSVNFTTTNNGVTSTWNKFGITSNSANNVTLLLFYRPGNDSGITTYSSRDFANWVTGWQSPQYQIIDFGNEYQSVSPEFVSWVNANTVSQDVQNSESYQLGYNAGLAVGQNTGYSSGYSAGQSYGYNQGYQAGLIEGSTGAIHGSEDIIAGTASLFAIKIFGTFSMLDCFLVIFGIGVCIWFLKMFAGG